LWEQVSGPGEANFSDPSLLEPSVTFSEVGSHLLRLTLSAGDVTESATTTVIITVPPNPPNGLRATALDGRVILNWDDTTDDNDITYTIYRATSTGEYNTTLATGHTASVFIDDTAKNGTSYYYVATKMNSRGVESPYSEEVFATPEAASALGGKVAFGSNHQGYAEFLKTEGSSTEIWSMQMDGAQHRNQSTGMKNSSFLRRFPIDRATGNIYTIEGVVHLTDGYTDDNARVGIYMFGDSSVVSNEDEAGALCLLINLDKGSVYLMEGIDKNTIDFSDVNRSIDDSIFGHNVKFTVNITFTGNNIQITGTFTDEFGVSTTVNATLPAASYTGDYFGFATRSRSRNYSVSGDPKSAPFVVEYESFYLSWDNEPLEGYRRWAKNWGIGKDALEFGDHDGDGVSNLAEFGLGGNPNDRLDRGTLPTFSRSGDSALFAFPRRNDTEELVYTVQTNPTLSPDSWSATRYRLGDIHPGDGAHDLVTVHIETEEPNLFVRLKIDRP
jgi:hypothetical protein